MVVQSSKGFFPGDFDGVVFGDEDGEDGIAAVYGVVRLPEIEHGPDGIAIFEDACGLSAPGELRAEFV